MPFPRRRSPLQFSGQDLLRLESISRSRTEEKRRSLRAAFLLDSRSGQSDEAIARHHHVSRSTVVLCIQKFLQFGLDAALGELPRPGKPRLNIDTFDSIYVLMGHALPKEAQSSPGLDLHSG